MGEYPAIHDYLSKFESRLRSRNDKGKFWWEMRACSFFSDFLEPKIVYPDIAKTPQFTYDEDGFYGGNTMYIMLTNKLYLLAILNSSLVNFYYMHNSALLQSDYLRFIAMYMKQIPIPRLSESHQDILDRLVRAMLFLNRNSQEKLFQDIPNSIIESEFYTLVNGCVYELYFPNELKTANVDVIRFVQMQIPPIEGTERITEIRDRIASAYGILRDPNGEIRNRLIRQNILVDEIRIINEALKK